MVIENKKTTIGVQLRRLLFIVALTTAIVLLLYSETFRDRFLGIDRTFYVVGLIVLYLVYYIWGTIRAYNFFYYNDMGVKLVFKYYSLAPLSKRQQSVEIEKNNFYKFQFEKKWMGLRIYVILYQKMAGGVAKYPPISLGLLSSKQIEDLQNSLKLFQKT